MASAAGVFSNYMAARQPAQPAASAQASSSTGSSTSTSTDSSSTISANDFLTLLVTEMQNQDPTATTDPNEYINQLVNVNSLEQLISINQTLSSAYGSSGSSGSASGAVSGATAQAQPASGTPAALQQAQTTLGASPNAAAQTVGGNLGAPSAAASSLAVAHALDGHGNPANIGLLNPLR
jgi:flagellar basal-body rod modification protein FlgD